MMLTIILLSGASLPIVALQFSFCQKHYFFGLSVSPSPQRSVRLSRSRECDISGTRRGIFLFKFGTNVHFDPKINCMRSIKHIFSPRSRIQTLGRTNFQTNFEHDNEDQFMTFYIQKVQRSHITVLFKKKTHLSGHY